MAFTALRSARSGLAMRILALLPVAAPPLVLGFGFILVFSSEMVPWLGSLWLLIAGQVVLTLPYIMQTVAADMRHLNLDLLENAAESLGAGFGERFFFIVLPSLRHSLIAGLVLVATRVIGEFQFANLSPDSCGGPIRWCCCRPSMVRPASPVPAPWCCCCWRCSAASARPLPDG